MEEDDCVGMKARPSSEVHLHHLGVVRNEGLWWFPWWGGHEETVEGLLHADESSVKGKGLCAPCRSRCGRGEQREEEDETFHYEIASETLRCGWPPHGAWGVVKN